MEGLECVDGPFQDCPFGRTRFYLVVVEGDKGVFVLLQGFGYVSHEGVKVLGPIDEAHGENQLRVSLVVDLDGDVVLGEHVAGAEAELEGVAQVDGDGDAFVETLVDGGLDGGLGGEDPGGAGEVNGDGMNVDAGNGEPQPFENVLGIESRGTWRSR